MSATFSMDEDHQLVARIAQADKQAITKLYQKYSPLVYGMALAIVPTKEDAEEVLIDVFAQVWRTALSYDQRRAKVSTWLITVTRSRSIDHLRKLQRQQKITIATQTTGEPTDPHTPEASAILSEQQASLQLALAKLPKEQQDVIQLTFFQGLTHKQTAQLLRIPEGTVKTRLRLGMAKLKSALGNSLNA